MSTADNRSAGFVHGPCRGFAPRSSLHGMPLFRVQLTEIRWLTATIEAKDAAAIRRTRAAWSKLEHSAPLPFEFRSAKLIKPSAAASRIPVPRLRSRRRSTRS
jgi:hypothetical protein